MLLCRHGIPLTANCAICAGTPMDLTEELLHYSICIKKWDGKLKEALGEKNYSDASFYARAVGNEYTRLALLLHEEDQRLGDLPHHGHDERG